MVLPLAPNVSAVMALLYFLQPVEWLSATPVRSEQKKPLSSEDATILCQVHRGHIRRSVHRWTRKWVRVVTQLKGAR